MKVERRLAAILMADAAGYSRLMSRDETATVRTLIAHRGIMDLLIVEHGGRIANTAGDSVLAEFASAGDALRAAVAMQERLAAINADLPEERRLEFRVGVHVGEVVPRGQDLLGDGVNIAARVQGVAPRGGVCLSADAHVHVRKMAGLAFEDLGPMRLKNLEEPVHVYAVRPQAGDGPAARPAAWEPAAPEAADTGPIPEARGLTPAWRGVPALAAAGAAAAALGVALFLFFRPEPAAPPVVAAVAPEPAASAAPTAARLTLLTAPAGGTCQAQLYQLQPRFAESVVEVQDGRPSIEIEGRDLCGLAVAGAAFQRGAGSAVVPSHSSANRIVFTQTGQPIVAPALVLSSGARVEIRIR